MRRISALLLLALATCGDDEPSQPFDPYCEEPPFDPGKPLLYETCGCHSTSPTWESPWWTACVADEDFVCIADTHGGTCVPWCTTDADCPAHPSGLAAKCRTSFSDDPYCYLPCDSGALACPEGMVCSVDECLHNYDPKRE